MQHNTTALRGVPIDQAASPFAPLDRGIVDGNRVKPPRFPIELFGEWGAWISDIAEQTSAPPDYVAMGLLSTTTTTIGNARWISPSAGWQHPPNLWIACIGDPSSGKSPALDASMRYLRDLENEMAEGFPDSMRDFERAREIATATLDDWKSDVKESVKAGRSSPPMPESAVMPDQPTPPRLFVIDATQEAMGRLMSGNKKGLLCRRDELSGWLQNFDRYSGGGGERAFYTEAFGGGEYSYDRIKNNDDQVKIQHLTVGVIGGLQPEKLAELLMKGSDDGFVARFLMVWPEPAPLKLSNAAPISPKYLNAIRRLNALQMATDEKGDAVPVIKMLSHDARMHHFEWQKKNRAESSEVYGLVLSHFGKLPGIVLRLAMAFEYLHWCLTDKPEPETIGIEAMGRAADLVDDYLKPMARRVYGDAALPPNEKRAAMLARRILKNREMIVNAGEVRRYWKLPGLRDSDSVRAAFDILVESGWLSPVIENRTTGAPKLDFHVNPELFGGA